MMFTLMKHQTLLHNMVMTNISIIKTMGKSVMIKIKTN
jgi:hypothetical protein